MDDQRDAHCEPEVDPEDDEQRRQEPARPTNPKGPEVDRAGALPLGKEQGRNEEPAEDEEEVDAEVTSTRRSEVVDPDHTADRNRAYPVQSRLIPETIHRAFRSSPPGCLLWRDESLGRLPRNDDECGTQGPLVESGHFVM